VPLSPHLSIYRVQITSFLSTLHRLSELFLYGVGILFFFLIFICAHTSFLDISLSSYSFFIKIFFSLLNIGLAYHLTSTLRYIGWDLGWGFDWVNCTGWASVIGAFLLGVLPFFLER
jgi:succinate dehydrogenase / fumarate reductase cytochrome b subunit